MRKLSTLLSLAITILATGCVPGNHAPWPAPKRAKFIGKQISATLTDLADEAPDSPKWRQFFEERGADIYWENQALSCVANSGQRYCFYG